MTVTPFKENLVTTCSPIMIIASSSHENYLAFSNSYRNWDIQLYHGPNPSLMWSVVNLHHQTRNSYSGGFLCKTSRHCISELQTICMHNGSNADVWRSSPTKNIGLHMLYLQVASAKFSALETELFFRVICINCHYPNDR